MVVVEILFGDMGMKCQFCHNKADSLIVMRVFSDGLKVCGSCYDEITKHKRHPYSNVMDKLALLETGYHANRKLARITRK